MSVKMDYHLSKEDWKIIRWVALILFILIFIGMNTDSQTSSNSSSTKQSTSQKPKVLKNKDKSASPAKSKTGQIAKPNSQSSTPQPTESTSPQPTETRSEYYFDWPPTANTRVSGEGGATILGNWQQVPGNEHWYYLTENDWQSCGGSEWCQYTWWVSDQVCMRPKPYTKSTQINGVTSEYEYFARPTGPYMTPHKAVLGKYVLVPWIASNQIVDKVIPDKYKYAVLSMSCS